MNDGRNNRLYGYQKTADFYSLAFSSDDDSSSESEKRKNKKNKKIANCGRTNDIIDPSLQTHNNCFISTIFKKKEIKSRDNYKYMMNRREYKFEILGQLNNVPNSYHFEEKFEFYNEIEDIFSQIFSKLIIKLDLLNNHNDPLLNSLIHEKDKYNIICKMQDYQINSDCCYSGRLHHEGLMSDCIKLVCIYVFEQSSWLSPCTLKITNSNGTERIETKENMAIVCLNLNAHHNLFFLFLFFLLLINQKNNNSTRKICFCF